MKFKIENRVTTGDENLFVIGDNADYVAEFLFDEEWNKVTKTARFISCNGSYVDVLLENDKCNIPCEVLKCGYCSVGVYSSTKATTEHQFFVHKSIKNDNCHVCEPTPNVYEQLIGKLDDIQAQIPEEIGTQVDEYFEDHKDELKGEQGEKGEAGSIKFLIVTTLPTTNIDGSALYLVPASDPDSQNKYDEYVYTNGTWEHIGTANVKIDLSDYAKIQQLPTKTSQLTNDSGFITAEDLPAVPTMEATLLDDGTYSLSITTPTEE